MCIGEASAFHAQDSRGLLQHLVRMHLGQQPSAEAIAQLRSLDKVACRICAGIRGRRTEHCTHCGCATATRPLQLGDSVPDRRRGGANAAAASPNLDGAANGPQAAAADTNTAQDENIDATRRSVRVASVGDAAKRMACSLQRGSLQRVPKAVASRMAVCWAESLEGSMDGDADWALLARYRSRLLLAPVPEGVDRNTELKRRLRLWELARFDDLILHVVGQQAEAERLDR
jgi:hypothetical protein